MLTVESILSLAPDEKSTKAAQAISQASAWRKLGKLEFRLWGLFQGSGSAPYETELNLDSAQFRCSCPSRKYPCKHGLALGLIYTNSPEAFTSDTVPSWLLDSIELKADEAKGLAVVPDSWQPMLADTLKEPYMQVLADFLSHERSQYSIYPSYKDVFSALEFTAFEDVRVLILGQDPYHGEGQAHGLSFSVQDGVAIPPSLRNIFKELEADLGYSAPESGFLKAWAEQGILMLNAVLTVRKGEANSHKNKGWETFTDFIIEQLNKKEEAVIFVLWGNYAQKKAKLIDESKHYIICSAHPSPLSAFNGFFGSKPFSKINELLAQMGHEPIDWEL